MGSLTKLAAVSLLGVFLFPGTLSRAEEQSATAQPTAPPPKSLFAQSAVQILGREFRDGGVSYLLFDARSANLLSSRWDDPASPIPLGSLVKPFTALAYAETHDFQYPTYVCKGEASGCWQLRPHGKLDIVSAIAISCNSYFRNLAQNLRAEQLLRTTNRFALESPDLKLAGPDLMGLGDRWLISPLRMARAYLELDRRRHQPGVREILAGMAQSAQHGTGAGVGRFLKHSDALVKTGTALCTHRHSAPADGFVVAMVPADQPEILLMIRVHGAAGAKASVMAGRMLRRIEE